VAVVSESFVQRYWPGADPLGRRFRFAEYERRVIGVVGDVRVRGFEQSSEPQAYLPYRQNPDRGFTWYAPKDLVVRTSAEPAALVPSIRKIIARADADLPVSDVQTMSDIVAEDTAPRALQLRVLGAFAALAFVLAAIGIQGVLSFAISQRAHEIGVRMALGARPGDILAMVLKGGLLLAGAGVLPGLGLAYGAARAVQGLLAGVNPGDTATFTAAAGLCLVMALAGSLWPALRALGVDPITVIRSE
jgi:predicted lysophospholipase L1 biosynthesis ABC-type transport system permease subunit